MMMMVTIWSDYMVLDDFVKRRRIDPFEKMSKDILNHFNYCYPHEIDMYDLCNAYRIRIVPSLLPEDSNYAISGKKGRQGVIHLCIVDEPSNIRETLAHEFSHLYLHEMNQILTKSAITDKMETQAFKLAANILMPAKDLLNIEIYPESNTSEFVAWDIAEYFGVTPEFALKRLKYFNENYKLHKDEPFRRLDEDDRLYNNLFKFPKNNYGMYKSMSSTKRKTVQHINENIAFHKLVLYIDSESKKIVELK